MNIPRIAIIGAGIAGLACARRLHSAGIAVELFDKARRAGGRMASRTLTLTTGTTLLDHGAQYFTARASDFLALCSAAQTAGVIAPWSGELRDERSPAPAAHDGDKRYRGTPDMNALPRWLAGGLTLQCQATVQGLQRHPSGWSLEFSDRPALVGYSAVIVALPAEQTAALLASVASALAAEAGAARSAPCWAALFGFGREARWPAWQALRPAEDHVLGWQSRWSWTDCTRYASLVANSS
jgi:renalase